MPMVVNCSIQGQHVDFSENDVHVALGIPNDKLMEVPTQDELAEFMDFINYSERINLASLNKKNLRKEWSFMFDSINRAFTCRKTGYDNISSVVQKLVFSMAHKRHLNMGLLILQELSTRLTMHVATRGELPTLSSEISNLISQISSSYNETLESDSQVLLKSSDMVQETMLTIQETHLVGERLHYGVDLDDTNTNIGVSSLFTKDPMVVSQASSCAKQSSQIDRFEGSTPEGELSKFSPIQLEVPHVGTTSLKTLADIALTIEARSPIYNEPIIGEESLAYSSASSLQEEQGFEAMVHDNNLVKSPPIQLEVPTSGEQHTFISTVSTDAQAQPITMNDLLVDQLSGLANITQQLLTTDMSNQDYQAVLLSYKTDVEDQHQKIVNEAEQDGNVDACNAKALSPREVYDVVTEVYKAQIKAFHLMSKALQQTLNNHQDKIRKLVRDKLDDLVPTQKVIDGPKPGKGGFHQQHQHQPHQHQHQGYHHAAKKSSYTSYGGGNLMAPSIPSAGFNMGVAPAGALTPASK
ncbi:hypothetical protein AgCh_011891 [Apium graveolens]